MKQFAVRQPGKQPHRGYLAPCPRCGERVVHAASTGLPFHMHWRSEKCRSKGKPCPHCKKSGRHRELAPTVTARGKVDRCWECGGEYRDGVLVWPKNVEKKRKGSHEEGTPII